MPKGYLNIISRSLSCQKSMPTNKTSAQMTNAESSFDNNTLAINKHASNGSLAHKMLYDSKRAYGSGNLKR